MSVKKMKNDKAGRWYVYCRYKDIFGVTRQKKKEGIRTRKEALAWEKEFLAQNDGKSAPGLTLDMLAQHWMDDMSKRCRESTCNLARNYYRLYIQPVLGAMLVDDIHAAQVRAYQNVLLELDLAPTTKRQAYSYLSLIFSYGVQFCGLQDSPTTGVRFCCPGKPDGTIWTQEQFNMFIHRVPDYVFKGKGVLLKIYFTLLFWSGLRPGEGLALTFSDFDFQKNTVNVDKTRDTHGTHAPKTETSYRIVSVPAVVMEQIKSYCNKLYKPTARYLLFSWYPGTLQRYWRQLLSKYGQDLPYIRIYALRHSHASLLYNLGTIPDKAISQHLGHSSTAQLNKTYAHLYGDAEQSVGNTLAFLINKKGR